MQTSAEQTWQSTGYPDMSSLCGQVMNLPDVHRLFRNLSADSPYAVMLGGSPHATSLNRQVKIGVHPDRILHLQGSQLSLMEAFPHDHENPRIRQQWVIDSPENLFAHLRNLTAEGCWMGFFGYEFYRYCDSAFWSQNPALPTDQPQMLLCCFPQVITFHVPVGEKQRDSQERSKTGYQNSYFSKFSASLTPTQFEQAVCYLKDNIQAGEIYQANLSLKLTKSVELDSPEQLYEALCRSNPSPFGGLMKTPRGCLISNSPERLVEGFQAESIWQVQTRPIAGTRGRGQTVEEDQIIAQALLGSEKERAEHLMLVDLLRNDLGRVCSPGSVTVDELLAIERYERVTHLVSNVKGELAYGKDMWDLIQSAFPGGTITGCPKVRCVEILSQVESVPRGFYTGSLGWFDSERFDWNILIRSLWLAPDAGSPLRYNASVHVGAGIVADSVGSHEYRECLRKAESVLGALYDHDHAT